MAAALAGADKKVEADYYIPHLAHATMEPPSATARIADGKAEIWTSVQSPQAAHDLVAKFLGLAPENVTVNVMLLGGDFGRKSKPDYAVEAALVSKGIGGAPVKVVWTREDDIKQRLLPHGLGRAPRRPASTRTARSPPGVTTASAPSIMSIFMPDPRHEANWEQGMGLIDMPFEVENIEHRERRAEAHTKIGWFRSVSNISARLRDPVLRC